MVINQLRTEPDKLWRLIKQQAFYRACNGNMEKHINPEKLEDDDRRRIVTVCVCRMYCIICIHIYIYYLYIYAVYLNNVENHMGLTNQGCCSATKKRDDPPRRVLVSGVSMCFFGTITHHIFICHGSNLNSLATNGTVPYVWPYSVGIFPKKKAYIYMVGTSNLGSWNGHWAWSPQWSWPQGFPN